jgi:hypothetical protein
MFPLVSSCKASCCSRALLSAIFFCILAAPSMSAPALAQSQPAVAAKSSEFRRSLPLTKFYDTPNPLPPGQPGELIRSETSDDYYLATDFSAFRILYHSRAAEGKDVAASGVVLVPAGTPPAGGWPVIAWAHGFSGAARRCAPSLMRNLYHGPFLAMYLNLGYAVVATDYAGLGTNFRNAAMDVPSNASDVIDSVAAAHAAVPHLSLKWVSMGPSLGGKAAIGVAEMESTIRDSGYLGSIAISGVADLQDVYQQLAKGRSSGLFELLAYGIKTIFPAFGVRDMLSEKALSTFPEVEQSCAGGTVSTELSSSEILTRNWRENQFVKEFFNRNKLGQQPAYGPLLVISDDGDPSVLAAMTAQAVADLCKRGDRVQLDRFSGSEPKCLGSRDDLPDEPLLAIVPEG